MIASNGPLSHRLQQSRQSTLGIASVAVFVLIISVLAVSYALAVRSQTNITDRWLRALWNPDYIKWMADFVPALLLGVVFGLAGNRPRYRDRRLAQLGIWLNLVGLLPLNVVPLIWHFFGITRTG